LRSIARSTDHAIGPFGTSVPAALRTNFDALSTFIASRRPTFI
jgi:hypothetical protein